MGVRPGRRLRPGLRRVEHVMGTAVSLDVADPLRPSTLDELADGVFAWLRLVDARFSTYRDDSEVSRLDRGTLSLPDASADLRAVLERCAELWGETDGYFDAYATGRLDPSGYVKGWAVQVASDRLLAAGAANHCLNAGGDVRVRGHASSGRPWRIGVRHPWNATKVAWVLAGTDLAVATSGVYERGHHVVDPRTGRPARGLRSVTVVGADLGVADAYATAAVAMGRSGADWLAGRAGHECAVVADDATCLRSAGLPVVGGGGPIGGGPIGGESASGESASGESIGGGSKGGAADGGGSAGGAADGAGSGGTRAGRGADTPFRGSTHDRYRTTL